MQRTSRQHEKMPDRVAVRQSVPGIENNPHCVAKTTQSNQDQDAVGNAVEYGFKSENADPAHAEINSHGYLVEAAHKNRLDHDSQHSQPPNHPKNRPTQPATQGDQRHRRVGARDQQKNRRVIEYSEHLFCGWICQDMIESGGCVKQDQSSPKNGKTSHVQGIAPQGGQFQQNRQSGDAQQSAEAVCDSIGDLFSRCV